MIIIGRENDEIPLIIENEKRGNYHGQWKSYSPMHSSTQQDLADQISWEDSPSMNQDIIVNQQDAEVNSRLNRGSLAIPGPEVRLLTLIYSIIQCELLYLCYIVV